MMQQPNADIDAAKILGAVILFSSGLIVAFIQRLSNKVDKVADSAIRMESILVDPATGGLVRTVADINNRVMHLERRRHNDENYSGPNRRGHASKP